MKSIKILAASLIVSMVAATSFTVPAYAADTACTVQQPTAGTTQKASAAEDKLFTDFDKLVKNLETMYAKNTIKAIYLSDITKSLIQIEKQINTGIKDTAKLNNLLTNAEKTVKGLDLNKKGLQKAGDVSGEKTKCLTKINSIKTNKKFQTQRAVNESIKKAEAEAKAKAEAAKKLEASRDQEIKELNEIMDYIDRIQEEYTANFPDGVTPGARPDLVKKLVSKFEPIKKYIKKAKSANGLEVVNRMSEFYDIAIKSENGINPDEFDLTQESFNILYLGICDVKSVYTKEAESQMEYGEIKPLYGKHTYGCANQEQYDFVMQKIKEAKQKNNGDFDQVSWERIEHYKDGTASDRETQWVQNHFGEELLKLSKKDLKDHLIIFSIYGKLVDESADVARGNSAYEYFVGGGDCNARANINSALYDSLGFSTRTVYSGTHAWCEVKINGIWYNTDGGLRETGGYTGMLEQPTF